MTFADDRPGMARNGSNAWAILGLVMIGIYLVVIAALLLTFGRLSDAIGRKRRC